MKKLAAVALVLAAFHAAAQTAAEKALAMEEFRIGVHSYYKCSFNEAITQFEKALSYFPTESLFLDWCGKAYYRAGIEHSAIDKWEFAASQGYKASLLGSAVDILRERRIASTDIASDARFVEEEAFQGKVGDEFFYSQPVSILPMNDGTFWAAAYGSNELLRLDANGAILSRSRGSANGFDRPMDILRLDDGTLLVSEFLGDRISHLTKEGEFIEYFGKKGGAEGELLGPQYMAKGESGNIFVSDFGNAKISVFSQKGEFLFDFGKKGDGFGGFSAPTGVAALQGVVFVADAVKGTIYSFDEFGNFISACLPEGTFKRAESLKPWGERILVSDTNKIYSFDAAKSRAAQIADIGYAESQITCAASDINGNIVACDFKANEICVLSKMDELAYGVFVQIDSVNSENFPQVELDVRIESKDRTPIVGLKGENFFISESGEPAAAQELAAAADNNEACDICVLIDRAAETAGADDQIQLAVSQIAATMGGGGNLYIACAGDIPAVEQSGSPESFRDFSLKSLKTPISKEPALDMGIRLAASRLIPGEKKRAVVFLSSGYSAPSAFERYSISDLSALLNNNGVSFAAVNVGQGALPEEIAYLSRKTRGAQYSVYRNDGLKSLVSDILERPCGVYRLRYTSRKSSDFGRALMPVEVEAYLFNRSGRDETEYFAPLE